MAFLPVCGTAWPDKAAHIYCRSLVTQWTKSMDFCRCRCPRSSDALLEKKKKTLIEVYYFLFGLNLSTQWLSDVDWMGDILYLNYSIC